jgi:tetratricopeptide (TPR) repeat protein
MSLSGNLSGKNPDRNKPPKVPAQPPATPPPAKSPLAHFSPAPLPGAPARLKAWDAYGRTCEIPREEWRTKVLPANFRDAWNKPDDLANLISLCLDDGFFADCLEPARQLQRIDPQPKRGATFLAVILLQLQQFEDAGKILTRALRRLGEDGVLLTNLAKAQAGRGDTGVAERTLWHALELEPNQDNGFGWYVTLHRERGGEDAALAAMRRVAALPGSWRAQLWLARAALQTRNLEPALVLYQEALGRAGKPVPWELLYQMSGDLGRAAHLPELLRLTAPHFVAAVHGLNVGNNLIKAFLELGQFDAARRILDQLYALNRSDWKQNLSFWDTEIAKARVAIAAPDPKDAIRLAMLTIDGPVWLSPGSPAAELFPVPAGESLSLAFLGGTAEIATNSKRLEHQLADAPGRMSRVLPLFLSEQVAFSSNAHVQTLIPWLVTDPSGFVLGGVPWKDDEAAQYAREGEIKSDYVVVTHLHPHADPWTAEVRLVRTIDGRCLGQLSAGWPAAKPEAGLPELVRHLLALLAEQAELAVAAPPPVYQVPPAPQFGNYLLRLEQLLAVRCAGTEGAKNNDFLNGEREIIDGNIQLCLAQPSNVGTRILLAQTLAGLKLVRPDIPPEFKHKIALLQKEKPLSGPARGVVQRLFNEVFAG